MLIPRLRAFWRNLVYRGRVERDLDDELAATFDALVEEHVRRGAPGHEARRAAARQLGQIAAIKDHVRDVRAGAVWDTMRQDVRYGARVLLRHLLSTLTAALSIALCIGANTAVFSLVNRLLLRDPPGVFEPHRLVDIAPTAEGRFSEPFVHPRLLGVLREHVTLLEGVYGHQLDLQPLSLRGETAAERVFGAFVTINYFDVLGVRAGIGRLFAARDNEETGASPVVVLNHAFWIQRFGGDAAVVGRDAWINGRSFTVIGVAPAAFRGISPFALPDLWLPASMAPILKGGGSVPLAAGGRLRPGVSVQQAAAEVEALASALARDLPDPPPLPAGTRDIRTLGLRVTDASPLPPIIRTLATGVLVLLTGLVMLVLAIACANVAGVLLARGAARRQEIAVRLAIGAGRTRLVRQLLTEAMLLFALGGAGGLVLARVMTSLLALALPPLPIPVDLSLPLDHRVFLFTAGLSLAAALSAGLLPALQSSKADVTRALKSDSQGPSDRLRLRSAFVVAQVALSLVLAVAAGLFVAALHRTSAVQTGFDAAGVEITTLDLSLGGYDEATGPGFVRDLVGQARALPGVAGASAATNPPGTGQVRLCCGVTVAGIDPPRGEPVFLPAWNVVEPGYFGTLRIPVLSGRDFTAGDRRGAEPVAIVSRAASQQFWPGERAVGKHMLWEQVPRGFAPGMPILIGPEGSVPRDPVRLTVVGVADDVVSGSGRAEPVVYVPLEQKYQGEISLVSRAAAGGRVAGEIRALVASVDPYLPVVSSTALSDQIGPVTFQLRLAAGVSAAVALVGILLAALGIYGVTAYAVTRRTREIGIRIAMGAQPADVVQMVLWHGMVLVCAGCAVGLALATAAGRLLAHNRFGIPPIDPVTFTGAAALFILVGLVACYLPVRRATRINAVEALRYE